MRRFVAGCLAFLLLAAITVSAQIIPLGGGGGVSDPLTIGTLVVTTLFTGGAASSTAANAVNIGETANCITFEGATADAIQSRLCATDPTAGDHTFFLPDITAGAQNGNILVQNASTATVWGGNSSTPQLGFNGTVTFGNAAGPSWSSGSLTTSTMTKETDAQMRSVISSFTWTNAMITALGGVGAGDIQVATLPAKTVVENAYVIILTPDTSANALTVACGRTSATYVDYITAQDAKAAANTVYGDASAERGTNLTGYDLPSYTATTGVFCHFIKTTTNLSTVLGSTGRVVLVTRALP